MSDEKPIDSTEALAAHVGRLVEVAKSYLDEQSKARETAMEYYSGEMKDFPSDAGRSSVVSMDVRGIVKKVMPSVMRTILGGGSVVKYLPVGPEDEDSAKQATEYVNQVVLQECDAEKAIYDAIHDALLLKTGILKWSAYRQRKVTIQEYTDQPDAAVLGLFDDPEVQILNYSTDEETDVDVLALDPNARRHSFKLRRVVETITPKLEAVPRGAFLITPGAESIEEAELVGEEQITTRSALVSMGYDKDLVWQIAAHDDEADDDDSRMGEDATTLRAETRKALEEVMIWEVYVRVDQDEDGVAEIYRVVFGEQGDGMVQSSPRHIVLGLEAVDSAPYADVVMERDPHQFEGHSIYEDTRDIQRVKTALLRATLDNLYAQNNQRPVVDLSRVDDPESVTNGKFGQPIFVKGGMSPRDVIEWQTVPFVAQHSFEMLGYMDEVAKDRTGITDASGGLDASKLHDVTAAAAAMASEAGIAQADTIVRSLANGGLRKAFRGLLRLVVAHSDGPRTVSLKGKWVEYNPAVWNVDMDCTVNVGLGGGTKERDMATLQIVYALQKELLMTMGPDNPFVKPEQLYNTLEKITEAAGFPSALPFFTSPDPEEVKAKLEAAKNAPNPEMQKLEAQMALEDKKMQVQASREDAQMQADMQIKMAELEKESIARREEMQAKMLQEEQRLAFEREKLAQEREIKMADIQARIGLAQFAAQNKPQAAAK